MPRRSASLHVTWLTSATLIFAACGAETAAPSATTVSPDTTVAPETTVSPDTTGAPAVPTDKISEQDLAVARASLDAARNRWEAAGLTDYTLELGYSTLTVYRFDVVGGEAVAEGIGPDEGDFLPRSMEEILQQVEDFVATAENDPSLVLPEGECGYHFNIEFDAELGYPTYYDSLGPCDDGVGVRVVVTP